MKRQARLGGAEHVLQLAHATLAVRQEPHDLESCLVRERVEPAGCQPIVGKGGRGHDHNISRYVDASSINATHEAASSDGAAASMPARSEEHTSELQSQSNLVCRLLLEKKKNKNREHYT